MAFHQYRIPVERLKEEWAERVRMEESGIKMPPKNPHENIPAVSRPTSIAELIEFSRQLNEAADLAASQPVVSANEASK